LLQVEREKRGGNGRKLAIVNHFHFKQGKKNGRQFVTIPLFATTIEEKKCDDSKFIIVNHFASSKKKKKMGDNNINKLIVVTLFTVTIIKD
jgi:hypothetical protein